MHNLNIAQKTMKSSEVATLTGMKHEQVKRSIRSLLSTSTIQAIDAIDDYLLDKRNSLVLVASLSPEFTAAIVDRWQELEAQAAKPMSQLEILAGMAQSMVDQERIQLEQAEAIAKVETKLVEVEKQVNGQIWDECPANAESITAVRARINEKYSIPAWAVNEMIQGDYAPRPAGSVRNKHENANGSTYVVYWKSATTKHIAQIAKECERVTATMVTHPHVSKRFKLVA